MEQNAHGCGQPDWFRSFIPLVLFFLTSRPLNILARNMVYQSGCAPTGINPQTFFVACTAGAIAAATGSPGWNALPGAGNWVDGLIADPHVEDCGPLANNCDGTTYLDRSVVVEG